MAKAFSFQGATVRRPGRTIVIACAVMLLPFVGFAFVAAGAPQWVRSLVGVVAVGEAFALLVLAMAFPRLIWGAGKPGATHVAVDERGLLLDGRCVIQRSKVSSVSVATSGDGHAHVVVAGAHRLATIDLQVDDESIARALAVALDDAASLPSFWVDSQPLLGTRRLQRLARRALVATPLFVLVLWFVNGHMRAVVPVGYVPLTLGFLIALFRHDAPTRAIFGTDGVALRTRTRTSGLGTRFIPFVEMQTIEAVSRGAVVTLSSGERLALHIAGVDASVDAQASTLARTLEAARRDVSVREHDPIVEARLARAKRSARDWLSELRDMRRTRAQGYRELAIADERLLSIVESPAAASSARAAAAFLVSTATAEEGRERIRLVASRTATPGLRDLLEATLREADDAELESLLDRSAR